VNPKVNAQVRKDILYGDFSIEPHQLIAKTAFSTDEIDPLVICDALERQGILEKVGGKDYIASLVENAPVGAGIANFTRIIKDLANRRRIIDDCSLAMEQAQNMTVPFDETLSSFQNKLSSIKVSSGKIENVYDAKRMVQEYADYIQDTEKTRFITGINEIDSKIRGVAGGEVMTIIGRAGSYKTAFLQNLLRRYTHNSNWAAAFFSLEMPISNLTERFHSTIQGCNGNDVEQRYIDKTADKYRRILEEDYIKDMKNVFVIPTKVGVQDIEGYIPVIEHGYNVKVGLIGIDYLGLLDSKITNAYERATQIALSVKLHSQ
jgi:replicative DNA helicase